MTGVPCLSSCSSVHGMFLEDTRRPMRQVAMPDLTVGELRAQCRERLVGVVTVGSAHREATRPQPVPSDPIWEPGPCQVCCAGEAPRGVVGSSAAVLEASPNRNLFRCLPLLLSKMLLSRVY